MKLNELADNPGARKARKRVGRGIGSGLGKTAGRGHKGQKSRSGVAIKGFEGGQMPLYRRLPKRGFSNRSAKTFALINLGRLQMAIDAGKLDAKAEITPDVLLAAGVISRLKDGVRLVSDGDLSQPITISVHGASKPAIAAVEKSGGKVDIIDVKASAEAGAE